MNIQEIMRNASNITIAVSAADLREFATGLIADTRRAITREIAERAEEVYYNAATVSKILDVNRSTLCRWANSKYLVPLRVGGLVRYRKSDIDKILKKDKP